MITCLSLKDGCKKFRNIFYFSKIPGPPPPLNICRNVELLFLSLSRDWKKQESLSNPNIQLVSHRVSSFTQVGALVDIVLKCKLYYYLVQLGSNAFSVIYLTSRLPMFSFFLFPLRESMFSSCDHLCTFG